MKLGYLNGDKRGTPGRVVLLFGVGLIGRCIYQSLTKNLNERFEDIAFDWNDGEARASQLASILKRTLNRPDAMVGAVDVVWSAGRAGFGAGAGEMAREDAPFDDVLRLSANLLDRLPAAAHRFHMMSSAGGLFEGQRLVERDSKPRPLRPYGMAKLAQETRMGELPAQIGRSTYRPSSVYGYNGLGGRAGLVTALIDNAKMHRTSHIYGDVNSLRDYVLATDIGHFVASRVLDERTEPGIFLLASGKPASIAEVIQIIDKIVNRQVYLRFDLQASNADHMTFAPAALPANWWPTSLETGIRLTARQLLGSSQAA